MLDEDARVTVVRIAQKVAISLGSVAAILHQKLHLSDIRVRWVHHTFAQVKRLPGWLGGVQSWLDSMLAAPILYGRWYVETKAGYRFSS